MFLFIPEARRRRHCNADFSPCCSFSKGAQAAMGFAILGISFSPSGTVSMVRPFRYRQKISALPTKIRRRGFRRGSGLEKARVALISEFGGRCFGCTEGLHQETGRIYLGVPRQKGQPGRRFECTSRSRNSKTRSATPGHLQRRDQALPGVVSGSWPGVLRHFAKISTPLAKYSSILS